MFIRWEWTGRTESSSDCCKLQHETEGKGWAVKWKTCWSWLSQFTFCLPLLSVCWGVALLMHTVLGASWVPALYTWAWLWLSIALLTFLHRSPFFFFFSSLSFSVYLSWSWADLLSNPPPPLSSDPFSKAQMHNTWSIQLQIKSSHFLFYSFLHFSRLPCKPWTRQCALHMLLWS